MRDMINNRRRDGQVRRARHQTLHAFFFYVLSLRLYFRELSVDDSTTKTHTYQDKGYLCTHRSAEHRVYNTDPEHLLFINITELQYNLSEHRKHLDFLAPGSRAPPPPCPTPHAS